LLLFTVEPTAGADFAGAFGANAWIGLRERKLSTGRYKPNNVFQICTSATYYIRQEVLRSVVLVGAFGGPELSIGWVDPRVGLDCVGLGWEWVNNFYFWWIGLCQGMKWQICEKHVSCTHETLYCEAMLRESVDNDVF